jgi:hypothetical protein
MPRSSFTKGGGGGTKGQGKGGGATRSSGWSPCRGEVRQVLECSQRRRVGRLWCQAKGRKRSSTRIFFAPAAVDVTRATQNAPGVSCCVHRAIHGTPIAPNLRQCTARDRARALPKRQMESTAAVQLVVLPQAAPRGAHMRHAHGRLPWRNVSPAQGLRHVTGALMSC